MSEPGSAIGKPFDLIELIVYGGPWALEDAERVGEEIRQALRDKFGLRLNAHVSDIRGNDVSAYPENDR